MTSYSEAAARNLGKEQQLTPAERYDLADEYMDVVYKLWESSFEEDAVVRDAESATYIDPAKVHPINHSGEHFTVPGFHLCEPSPQRTPVLFQAGSSSRGMEFGGKHAEAVFIQSTSVEGAKRTVAKLRQAVADAGRDPRDVKVVILLTVVVAPTDEEAQAKYQQGRGQRPDRWNPGPLQWLDRHRHVRIRTRYPLAVRWNQGGAVHGGHVLQGGPGPGLDAAPDRRVPRRRRHRLPPSSAPRKPSQPNCAAGATRQTSTASTSATSPSPGAGKSSSNWRLPELRAQGLVAPARAEDQEPVTLREKLFGQKYTLDGHPATAQRAKHLSEAAR